LCGWLAGSTSSPFSSSSSSRARRFETHPCIHSQCIQTRIVHIQVRK
jgi:hypothetical protein